MANDGAPAEVKGQPQAPRGFKGGGLDHFKELLVAYEDAQGEYDTFRKGHNAAAFGLGLVEDGAWTRTVRTRLDRLAPNTHTYRIGTHRGWPSQDVRNMAYMVPANKVGIIISEIVEKLIEEKTLPLQDAKDKLRQQFREELLQDGRREVRVDGGQSIVRITP